MEELIISEQIVEYTRFAQFNTLEAYNAVNLQIVSYKDEQSGGEYSRTGTVYEYTHEPEPAWDGMYYMPATPEMVEAGLFDQCLLFDAIPEPAKPDSTWLKADIQNWLTAEGIDFNTSDTKQQLIDRVQ